MTVLLRRLASVLVPTYEYLEQSDGCIMGDSSDEIEWILAILDFNDALIIIPALLQNI